MARKKNFNKTIFEDKIKDQLNMSLRRDIADPRLVMASITRVELTADYSQAKVYWDTFDANKRGDIKKAMEGVAPALRSILAKELNVRHTPELQFFYDSQFEDERKIEEILASDSESES
ncbi:MAG: 30S ribosome-binding factor RbfA [Bdellovibrionota bacterium]|nr:30S ribosome-binding factor RbfA [Bdellovibrionota bacterium]